MPVEFAKKRQRENDYYHTSLITWIFQIFENFNICKSKNNMLCTKLRIVWNILFLKFCSNLKHCDNKFYETQRLVFSSLGVHFCTIPKYSLQLTFITIFWHLMELFWERSSFYISLMVSANHKKCRSYSSGLNVTSDISQILIHAGTFQTDSKQCVESVFYQEKMASNYRVPEGKCLYM